MRAARRGAGLTQHELARLLGTGQSAIARWEAGHRSPTVETLQLAARLCGFELATSLVPSRASEVDSLRVRELLKLSVEERVELAGIEGRNLLAFDAEVGRR